MAKTSRQILNAQIGEAQLTRNILKLARLLGWKSAHFRAGRVTIKGRETYRTAIQGDGAGFPDLVLVHPEKKRLIFAEIKAEDGKRTQTQEEWYCWLSPVADFYFWQPNGWDEIVEILKGE